MPYYTNEPNPRTRLPTELPPVNPQKPCLLPRCCRFLLLVGVLQVDPRVSLDIDEQVLILKVAIPLLGVARHMQLCEAPVKRALDLVRAALVDALMGARAGTYVELHHQVFDSVSVRGNC